MSLNKVLEEIKKVKPFAEEDINGGNPSTFQNRLGRKRNAVEEMKRLREKYIDELRLTAAFILVTGSAQTTFGEVASAEFGCFTADPEGFYKDLASTIPPVLYENKQGSAALLDIVGRHMEDMAYEMQIVGYPQVVYKQQYNRLIPDKVSFVDFLKQVFNEQVGPEIAGIHAIRSLADKAIKADHGGRITPIVMASDDEKLLVDLSNSLKLLGSRSFMVSAGKGSKVVKNTEGAFVVKEVTKENVENILINIKNLCKGR